MTYLTDNEVREIIKLWLEGNTQASLARRFNVSYGHINNIVWGRKRVARGNDVARGYRLSGIRTKAS